MLRIAKNCGNGRSVEIIYLPTFSRRNGDYIELHIYRNDDSPSDPPFPYGLPFRLFKPTTVDVATLAGCIQANQIGVMLDYLQERVSDSHGQEVIAKAMEFACW